MIERYLEVLVQLRKKEIELKEFLYTEGLDEGKLSYDLNAKKRFQLLKALQYNLLETDEFLLVELLKAEIEDHRKAPLQGLHPALSLNAFLLSQYRKPEYTELFLKAKRANFDTHCGFDYQFLVSAGIQETYEYMEKANPVFREDFFEYMGKSRDECNVTEQELGHWKEAMGKAYPDKLEFKDITDEIQLAIELDEKIILEDKISQWEHSIHLWSQSELQQLSYYKGLIANTQGQIRANEQLMHFMASDRDKASGLLRLSELYLKVGDHKNAWAKLKQIQVHLKAISDWQKYGLGRSIVEAYFDLILLINNTKDSGVKDAYKWASNKISKMNNLHLNLIEKAAKAGDLMMDFKFSKKFYAVLEREKRKYDDLIQQTAKEDKTLP